MITWGDIKSDINNDLNLGDEVFVTPVEMLGYCRDAIRFAEAEIHKLSIEDRYFESMTALPLRALYRDYALPVNIYGNKITRLVYVNNNDIYPIERLTKLRRYEDAALIKLYPSSSLDRYNYMIVNNDKSAGPRIRISPTPVVNAPSVTVTCTGNLGEDIVTTSNVLAAQLVADQVVSGAGVPLNTSVIAWSVLAGVYTIRISEVLTAAVSGSIVFTQPLVQVWFIRNAFIPVLDADVIDIPEFSTFIKQFVKVECIKKEKLNPMLGDEQAKLLILKEQMIATLTEMVPDQADEIEKDLDIYRSFS